MPDAEHEPTIVARGDSAPICAEPVAASQLDLESLRAAFPDWRLGGAPGYWFAVRGGVEVASGPRSLLRRCLSASTLEALADMPCLQDYLDGLSDHELADVWQRAGLPQSGQAS